MKRKIIFLDFDGVITTVKSKWKLDKEKLDIFGTLLEKTGAEIVISSSWRKHDLESTIKFITKPSHFVPFPFPYSDKVIGVTNRLSFKCRGEEIKSYLNEILEPGTFNYVILDDNNDMLDEQQEFFIETDWELGINESDVEKAAEILNRE